ncbi:hypothetical protein T484DRAFT_1834164 [Baffinella frigidus]|nr:hypothetical protein T484DRAFT_1834164 [Cryptophyta sp. CCMP2293]
MRQLYDTELRACSKCSGEKGDVIFHSDHRLRRAPAVFCLQLVWDSGVVSKADISVCIGQIPLSIDLQGVYSGLGPSRYRLRSIVCYYAKHYVLIAYRPCIKKWVLLDDSLATVVGDGGWSDVRTKCTQGCLQPLICFFQSVK